MVYSMNVGGVEKSLLGLLSSLPLDRLDVHVGIVHSKGGFLPYLPKKVEVHEIDIYKKLWPLLKQPPLVSVKQLYHKGCYWDAIVFLSLYILSKIQNNRHWIYKYLLRNEPLFNESFDLAIAYAGPSADIDYYICEKVKAQNKVGWVHFDVSKFGIDKGLTRQLYKQYKKIFVVSDTGKQIFDQMFPMFRYKTEVFYNIVSPKQVLALAATATTFSDNYAGKRILTVGRIAIEKGQREAIRALGELVEKGLDVKWYFVGEGHDMESCRLLSKELGLTERIVFLGCQTNPYGYMRDCDVYVQPSRHEGFCITLAEALCFENPIVATNFTGAHEQLDTRANGVVCAMDKQSIAEAISKVLTMKKCKPENREPEQIDVLLDILEDNGRAC